MTTDRQHTASPRQQIAKFVKRLLLGLLVVVLLVLGLLAGLVSSEGGTRFLAEQAKDWLGEDIRWQELNGRAVGPLEIRGLQVSLPGIEVEINRLALDWQPGALMQGKLHITRFEAENGSVVLAPGEPPGSPDSSVTFDPTTLQPPMDLHISDARIREVAVYQGDALLQRIKTLEMAATSSGAEIFLQHFDIRVPEGGLAMNADTALRSSMPLRMEVAWDWRMPAATVADPAADSASKASAATVPLQGELRLDGSIDWRAAIHADLDYEIAVEGVDALAPELPRNLALSGRFKGAQSDARVQIEQLTLALSDTPLTLEVVGTVDDLDAETLASDLSVTWQGLQWPINAPEPMMSSTRGQLEFSGSPSAYDLAFDGSLAGDGIPPGQWQLRGSGDETSFTFETLTGSVLGGDLQASGPVRWDPVPSWELKVRGTAVDAAAVLDDITGTLSFTLETAGHIDAQSGIMADLTIQELRGALMEYPLDASATVRLTGERVDLDALRITNDGNAITARGYVDADTIALDWELDLANPSAHLDGARGQLNAQGTLTGSTEAPRIAATFQAADLALDALTIATVEGSAEAGLQPQDPLTIDMTLGAVRSGGDPVIDGAQWHLNGTLYQHEITLAADTAAERVELRLEGGLNEQLATWSGLLSQLSFSTNDYGRWQLRTPSDLTLGAERIALGESCLQREDAAGSICVETQRSVTGDMTFAAAIVDFPVAQFVPGVTGSVAGQARGGLAADGQLTTRAEFSMTAGEVAVPTAEGEEFLPHGGAQLRLTVDADGLIADMEFTAPEEGRLAAKARLPGLTTIPPADGQPLEGRITATLPRLDILAGWVSEIESLQGRLDADFQLAGTLEKPAITGQLGLTEAQADVPRAGLALRDIELTAATHPDNPTLLDIVGSLSSGDGKLAIAGDADLAAGAFTLSLEGDRLQVVNTRDARATLSPDVELSWRDDTLRVRGDLVIPYAAITPQLSLTTAATTETAAEATADSTPEVIAPSPDVVVINRESDQTTEAPLDALPFALDSQVRLILGDQVSVDAVGFKSRLAGTVVFINPPGRPSIIPIAGGRIDVLDGTFRAYGQDLDIETGELIFPGAPATEPELNVRAVRWIEDDPEVTAAGVFIHGPANQPVLELFSQPHLEEPSEIRSYLLTGRSQSNTVLSIGTYLTPRIFVGYGYNLLESTSEFESVFNITPLYGVSANAGAADSNINLSVTYEN